MSYSTPPETRIGHIHLTVADLDRSLKFYCEILGFEITQLYGDSAVFISAGGYHHHIGLNTWAGKDAVPPPKGHTGLYHFAIVYPTRRDLAAIVKRLYELNFPLKGASDHGVSESIYLSDPDGNGIELYCDRDEESWPYNSEGKLEMVTKPLDLLGLLSELDD